MPTLSNYWFEDHDFRGNTTYFSLPHGSGVWAWINWSNIGSRDSTLVWEREDREIVVDLVPQLNTPDVLNLIDGLLGSDVQRTSPIRAGWIPWKYVPYYTSGTGRNDLTLLVRMFFDFHIDTPWYCTDANGDISYYILFSLDSAGQLRANVDGWSYHYDGGGPFCTGAISGRLSREVPRGMSTVQNELNDRLALFSFLRFDLLYLLPGSGEDSGSGTVNVDQRVSLALLPR